MLEYAFLLKECLIPVFIITIASYLIGCINTSLIVTKLLKRGNNIPDNDIRNVGSGNAGFTNVLRTAGKKLAIFTFIGDFAKGVLAVWFGKWFISFYLGAPLGNNDSVIQYGAYLAGFMCILGHIYPCFFKFKGGKGVLTTWAMTLLLDWRVFLIIIVVFLIALLIAKIASLSSLIAAVSYPITTFLILYFTDYKTNQNFCSILFPIIISLIISAIIIYKHKSNISRILKGTENKISIHK